MTPQHYYWRITTTTCPPSWASTGTRWLWRLSVRWWYYYQLFLLFCNAIKATWYLLSIISRVPFHSHFYAVRGIWGDTTHRVACGLPNAPPLSHSLTLSYMVMLHPIPPSEMYAVPSLINSLLGNFSSNGPASLHLYPDEKPVTTSTTTYTHYLDGLHITKDDADNLTQVIWHTVNATQWYKELKKDK